MQLRLWIKSRLHSSAIETVLDKSLWYNWDCIFNNSEDRLECTENDYIEMRAEKANMWIFSWKSHFRRRPQNEHTPWENCDMFSLNCWKKLQLKKAKVTIHYMRAHKMFREKFNVPKKEKRSCNSARTENKATTSRKIERLKIQKASRRERKEKRRTEQLTFASRRFLVATTRL